MYPTSLIPKKEYVKEISVECLIASGDFYLIRRVDDTLENIIDETGFVRSIAFISTLESGQRIIELPGLSVNLLSLHCDETSTCFKPKNRGKDDWDGIKIISEEELPPLYDPVTGHTNLYIQMSALQSLRFDVKQIKQGNTIKKLGSKEYLETSEMNEKGILVEYVIIKEDGLFVFKHVPTMINYWHFELHCSIDEKLINRSKQNSTERSSLELALINHITMATYADIPDPKNLDPEDCYKIAV